jgi:hypothetical protein
MLSTATTSSLQKPKLAASSLPVIPFAAQREFCFLTHYCYSVNHNRAAYAIAGYILLLGEARLFLVTEAFETASLPGGHSVFSVLEAKVRSRSLLPSS